MKKTLVKITVATLLFFLFCHFAVGCRTVMVNADGERGQNYLIIGLDDAASNADVIMLINSKPRENRLTVLQIPRDTFYNYGGGQNKINGVFAAGKGRGLSDKESLTAFSERIEDAFDIDLTASFAITLAAFGRFVSDIGGVAVDMPYDYTFTDEHGEGEFTLREGENLLTADMAETFIRYRAGYALGDLSRINAQKIFLKGMIKTVASKRAWDILPAVLGMRGDIYTNCEISDIVKILAKKPGRNEEILAKFITLPGEAVMSSGGGSYFCANRKNCARLLSAYFGGGEFDSELLLLNSNEPSFHNVYYDENADYTEYDGNDLDSIKLR